MPKDKAKADEAPAAGKCEPCPICGRPHLPKGATAWVLGQCYRGASVLDAYNDGTADCYRLGYQVERVVTAALSVALRGALAWEAETRQRLGLPQIDAPDWAQAARAALAKAEGRSAPTAPPAIASDSTSEGDDP